MKQYTDELNRMEQEVVSKDLQLIELKNKCHELVAEVREVRMERKKQKPPKPRHRRNSSTPQFRKRRQKRKRHDSPQGKPDPGKTNPYHSDAVEEYYSNYQPMDQYLLGLDPETLAKKLYKSETENR